MTNYGELVHSESYKGGMIRLYIDPSDISVHGSFSNGDDAEDKRIEADIMQDFDNGNTWAWCDVTVTYEINGIEMGCDHSSGCNYTDLDQFIQEGGYYQDMIEVAYDEAVEACKPMIAWFGQQLTDAKEG